MVIDDPMDPRFNIFDVTKDCENPPLCYDFSHADVFFNDPLVKQTLGTEDRKWRECDSQVHAHLLGDWSFDAKPLIAQLLDEFKINVLVYNGEDDWVCNWRGGEACMDRMHWDGADNFR